MKIFISWSGENSASHMLAQGLAQWLEDCFPQVKPFFSTEDIKKGQAWFDKIAHELDASDFGVLCITPQNIDSPWLLFEAGAIAKKVGRSKVVPLTIGMALAELKPPVSMFNGAVPTKADIKKVLESINGEFGETALDEKRLDRIFEKWWPDLEKTISSADAKLRQDLAGHAQRSKRTVEDMMQELLDLVRGLSRRDIPETFTGILTPAETQALRSSSRRRSPLTIADLVIGSSGERQRGAAAARAGSDSASQGEASKTLLGDITPARALELRPKDNDRIEEIRRMVVDAIQKAEKKN
jgi:hypothetical protein